MRIKEADNMNRYNNVRFSYVYCDRSELINKVKDLGMKIIHGCLLPISTVYECFKNHTSIFNELVGHLKCPYCRTEKLRYYTYKRNRYGYFKSYNSIEHSKICKYFYNHYEKEHNNYVSDNILRNPHKLSDKRVSNIIDRYKPGNNVGNNDNSDDNPFNTPIILRHIHKDDNKSRGSSVRNIIRRLQWGYDRFNPNDDGQLCVFHGPTSSVETTYKCQSSRNKKYFGDKKIFLVKSSNGKVKKLSFIKKWDTNEGFIKKCIKDHEKNDELFKNPTFNKSFIVVCKLIYKSYYNGPCFNILHYKNDWPKPTMWLES